MLYDGYRLNAKVRAMYGGFHGRRGDGVLSLPVLNLAAAKLAVHDVDAHSTTVAVVAQTTAPEARCPLCHQPSQRIHSRYVRKLADLPWQGQVGRIRLQVRRFFCLASECPRRIFAERLPFAAAFGRTTTRLRDTHLEIGLFLGAEPGARLARRLAVPTSPDTLLRRIRSAPLPEWPTPRVLGVDDWAMRRGRVYGTILCDLEQGGRPVDLLPDREAITLANWLKGHPGVEVISRDRAGAYAQGARDGAPAATQIADRWHLLRNIREMLENLLGRHRSQLNEAVQAVVAPSPVALPAPTESQTSTQALVSSPALIEFKTSTLAPVSRASALSAARRERRRERYEEVKALQQQGYSERAIARRLHFGRKTVQRYCRAAAFPERCARRNRLSQIEPYGGEVRRRWEGGCRNAMQICREMRAQNYPVTYWMVRKYIQKLRRQESTQPRPVQPPSPRRASWLLLGGAWEVTPQEHQFVEILCQKDDEIGRTAKLASHLAQMVRKRREPVLEEWLQQAEAEGMPNELRRFAFVLRQDQAAVEAAMKEKWSNGPVEGAVNRLKTIKRQMYGRANFDLLRKRVLLAA